MTTTIKTLNEITGRNVSPATPLQTKIRLVYNNIDCSKYDFIGMVDRTNLAVLETRYHDIRNRKGQFAKVSQR